MSQAFGKKETQLPLHVQPYGANEGHKVHKKHNHTNRAFHLSHGRWTKDLSNSPRDSIRKLMLQSAVDDSARQPIAELAFQSYTTSR
eukprot:scaffold73800_cov34-Prasinocladus_malaysianus.AAC.1